MPVFKYKTFKEAEKGLWNFNPDERYLEGIAQFWNFAGSISQIKYPRGLFKYKSIKQADAQMNLLKFNCLKRQNCPLTRKDLLYRILPRKWRGL